MVPKVIIVYLRKKLRTISKYFVVLRFFVSASLRVIKKRESILPTKVPGKASREAQEKFLAEHQELFEKEDQKNPVYFADGVHPQHNTKCAYGWIKKGLDKEIKTNTGRQRININGAMNAHRPDEILITESDSVNAQSTIDLFQKIELANPKADTITIIIDNARYYHSKLVSEYVEGSKIKLCFLPSYSPNLNLIERLWRLMNKVVLYNQYFEKFEQFKIAILNFFKNSEDYASDLRSLMNMKFQIIGD
jgi:transposase